MQEWQVIFMATDITNVYPSFSMFVFPFHPVVLSADFDRLMDRSELILRAIVLLASQKRNAEIKNIMPQFIIYRVVNIGKTGGLRGSLGKQAHWKLELTRTIIYRNPRKRKICTGNIFITNGLIISVSL